MPRLLGRSAILLAFLWLLASPASAFSANPTIQGVPDTTWHYTDGNPPITFEVKNTSQRGQGPRHIDSIHIITNAPNSAPMRPLNIYRTRPDGGTSAQSPNCFQRGTNGLECNGLDASAGDKLTVDFTTTPNPYPHSATITVIADSKVGNEEVLGDPITLAGPGPSKSPPPPLPPPPNGEMSSGGKKAVKVIDKALNTAGNAIGLYAAYAALFPSPDPASKGTALWLGLTAAALKVVGSGVGLVGELVDPFDPNYRAITRALPIHAPRVGEGEGIPKAVARAINRLTSNAGRIDATGSALLTSYNRAASAAKKHNLAARSRQLGAAARFARSLAKLLDGDPALRRHLARAIRATHQSLVVSTGKVGQARRRVRRGPPTALVSPLRAFGMSGAEIRDFVREIGNAQFPSDSSITGMLANRHADGAEHAAAAGFRQVARAFLAAA